MLHNGLMEKIYTSVQVEQEALSYSSVGELLA
jgi:hypothetical protein